MHSNRQCPRRFAGPAPSKPGLSFLLPAVMRSYLDFEKPVAELEAKVEELRALGENRDAVAISDDVARLARRRRPPWRSSTRR